MMIAFTVLKMEFDTSHLFVIIYSITQIILLNGKTIDEKLLEALKRDGKEPSNVKIPGHQLVELDMLLPDDVSTPSLSGHEDGDRKKRKAVHLRSKLWPGGIVPYFISSKFDDAQKRDIQKAMDSIEAISCVVFRPKTVADSSYMSVVDDSIGCLASIGFRTGSRTLNLNRQNCFVHEVIVHELGHILGFYHEQSRPDRDEWITVLTENVTPEFVDNFDIKSADSYGVPYDYLSVLHYGRKTFTSNGMDTIITKDPKFQSRIGKAPHMSFLDATLLNKVYPCPQNDGCEAVVCPNQAFKGKNCQCFCRANDGVDATICAPFTTPTTRQTTPEATTVPTTTETSTETKITEMSSTHAVTPVVTSITSTSTKERCLDKSDPLTCLFASGECSTSLVAQQCRATCRLCTDFDMGHPSCMDYSETCSLVQLNVLFCFLPGFFAACPASCRVCVPEV